MQLDFYVAAAHGLILGTLLGFVPGLGVLSGVLFSMSFLFEYSMMAIFIFYLALIISSQYTGSIVATFFGVPGEITSAPAAKIGYRFHNRGLGNHAIVLAAMGSLIASVFAIVSIYFLIKTLYDQTWIHKNTVGAAILFFVIFYLSFINRNYFSNFAMVIAGLCLGAVGNKHGLQELNFSFGIDWLETGLSLPFILLLCFVIPNLWMHNDKLNKDKRPNKIKIKNNLNYNLFLLIKNKWALMRGTILGCASGLIPGVGTSISSNISWGLEKAIKSSASKQLIAAESANNSAMISSLIPLILFGVPIVASENLVLQIMETKGSSVGLGWFYGIEGNLSRLDIFCIFGLFISFIMYVIATNFAVKLTKLMCMIPSYFFRVILPISMAIFFVYQAQLNNELHKSLLTAILCVPIMLWAIKQKINTLPLIFGAMLCPALLEKSMIVWALFGQ